MRWDKVEPNPGSYSTGHLTRYALAKGIMHEAGLEAPTIILSNPPKWAVELYKTDKEKFFTAYQDYVEQVKDSLAQTGGEKISRVQILNELNNKVYTPVRTEDVPRMCNITREAFHEYNPDIKLMATLLASNTTWFVGTPIEKYLTEFEKIKDSFDIIAVDYYPGLWHLDARGASSLQPSELYKQMVKKTELLKKVFEKIASWGKEYELGEVGAPTNEPWASEKGQRYFYDKFFLEFKHLLADFQKHGLKLPSRVGLYEAKDEPPRTLTGKILRRMTPFPEHDLGMREGDGRRKLVLQGNVRLPEAERAQGPSQLSNIIRFLKASRQKTKQ